jgi:hypothetical protein
MSLVWGIPACPCGGNVTWEREGPRARVLVERSWPGVTSQKLLEALQRPGPSASVSQHLG